MVTEPINNILSQPSGHSFSTPKGNCSCSSPTNGRASTSSRAGTWNWAKGWSRQSSANRKRKPGWMFMLWRSSTSRNSSTIPPSGSRVISSSSILPARRITRKWCSTTKQRDTSGSSRARPCRWHWTRTRAGQSRCI